MNQPMVAEYPERSIDRDRWIVSQRPTHAPVDARRPSACFVEEEFAHTRTLTTVATIFLTNRECPWRCLMCDLWRHTLTETVPTGTIPSQIDMALSELPPARQIKLYNSGSFFDPRAIPPSDYPAIAARLGSFERVIVECHPALIGDACLKFRDLLNCQLEIAMGLETVHPTVLPKLNKRMSLSDYARAAKFLFQHEVALRSFILVKPPFMTEAESLTWAQRSLDFAQDCQAGVASLIPTRPGNGALETLAASGLFAPPKLATVEAALGYGIRRTRMRVFTDLWDIEKFADCHCSRNRIERLRTMNRIQSIPPPTQCEFCGSSAS